MRDRGRKFTKCYETNLAILHPVTSNQSLRDKRHRGSIIIYEKETG